MNIAFVQPILTKYREPVLEELAAHSKLAVFFSKETLDKGFGDINNGLDYSAHVISTKNLFDKVFWQVGLVKRVIQIKPDIIHCFGNFRYLSNIWLLIVARIYGIKFCWHGHGFLNNKNKGIFARKLYKLLVQFSNFYICYTEASKDSMLAIGCASKKLAVVNNTLVNSTPINPAQKNLADRNVLFVGRLREGNCLHHLIDCMQSIIDERGMVFKLEVIGTGEEAIQLQQKYAEYNWITWHGAVYDQHAIAEIAKKCLMGCYPGDCGLSVVHYMSLSLIPIVHDQIAQHMGPEPSYIKHNENGLLFAKDGLPESLKIQLERLVIADANELEHLTENSYQTYLNLITPSMAQQFMDIYERALAQNK